MYGVAGVVLAGISLVAGIAVGTLFPVQPAVAAWAAATSALAAGVAYRLRGVSVLLFLLCLACAGAWRGSSFVSAPPALLAEWNGTAHVTVTGLVVEEPERRDTYQRLTLDAQTVEDATGRHHVDGRLLADVSRDAGYAYGDVLRMTGTLATPPEFPGFDYRSYLWRQGVIATMRFPAVESVDRGQGNPVLLHLSRLRARLVTSLNQVLTEPYASLAAGLLIGWRTGLDSAVVSGFARTGTTHLLAVSGYNMSVVAGLVFALLLPLLGRRGAIPLAIMAIVVYTGFTGGGPAVIRAAIMAIGAMVGVAFGRQRDGLVLLVLAAAGLALGNPYVLQDVGFQLSVTATAGLILLAPPLEQWLARAPVLARSNFRYAVAAWLAVPIAANLATLPILAATFSTISLVSLPANLAAGVLVPPAMLTSGLAAAATVVSLEVGRLLAVPAWLFDAALIAVVDLFSRLPGAAIRVGSVPGSAVAAYYLVLTGLALMWQRPDRVQWARNALRPVAAPGGALFAVAAWSLVLVHPDSGLKVSALDVGGEAVLVRSPAGRVVLVDGGPNAAALLTELGRRVGFWNQHLNLVVVTGWENERVAALGDLARRMDIDGVVGPRPAVPAPNRLSTLLDQRDVPVSYLTRRTRIDLGDGTSLVLLPQSAGGLAVSVEQNGFSVAIGDSDRMLPAATLRIEPMFRGGRAGQALQLISPSGTWNTAEDGRLDVAVLNDRVEIRAPNR